MSTPRRVVALSIGVVVIAAWLALAVSRRPEGHTSAWSPQQSSALATVTWPRAGQSALDVDGLRLDSGRQTAVPIASVAKVMTALVVLHEHPLSVDGTGPTITVDEQSAADTARRAGEDQSIVPVETGETLTQRHALEALLVPSANNIAALLARWTSGDEDTFVQRMNDTARRLHLRHTRFTDPSGFDDATTSSAADQVSVLVAALRVPALARIVALRHVTLPVAGDIDSTVVVFGRSGLTAGKTGSDDAAGSCFVFRARWRLGGRTVTVTGAVLGQPGGHNAVPAQLEAVRLVSDLRARAVALPSGS